MKHEIKPSDVYGTAPGTRERLEALLQADHLTIVGFRPARPTDLFIDLALIPIVATAHLGVRATEPRFIVEREKAKTDSTQFPRLEWKAEVVTMASIYPGLTYDAFKEYCVQHGVRFVAFRPPSPGELVVLPAVVPSGRLMVEPERASLASTPFCRLIVERVPTGESQMNKVWE